MRVLEALAIASTTAAIGGGVGTYIELGHEADARATAISAQACLNTYVPDKDGNISQATLDCLKNGWVPNGQTATPNLRAGDAANLYIGYIKEEQAEGSHLDARSILALAAGGLALGLYIAYKMDAEESQPKKTSAQEMSPKQSASPAVHGSPKVNLSK